MKCYNCNYTDPGIIRNCENCDISGCLRCIRTICYKCRIQLCSNCNNDETVGCNCYGGCSLCDTEICNGENGLHCCKCDKWYCYDCSGEPICKNCSIDEYVCSSCYDVPEKCNNCCTIGCSECIKTLCNDCNFKICSKCSKNRNIKCFCYNYCTSCKGVIDDVNWGDNEWPCFLCRISKEWYCDKCRHKSTCIKCSKVYN